MPTVDVARYLEHAGSECTFCHLPGVWHNHTKAEFLNVAGVGVLYMPCACLRCKGSWIERYRLEGIEGTSS